MKEFLNRLIWVTFLLYSITIFPWWFVGIFGIILTFIFNNFFEIIVIGVVYDITFHIPGSPWYLWGMHTIFAIIIYVIMVIIQKNTQKPQPLL